jgi:hypothetical protein
VVPVIQKGEQPIDADASLYDYALVMTRDD